VYDPDRLRPPARRHHDAMVTEGVRAQTLDRVWRAAVRYFRRHGVGPAARKRFVELSFAGSRGYVRRASAYECVGFVAFLEGIAGQASGVALREMNADPTLDYRTAVAGMLRPTAAGRAA
jgi:hypothetical protein